MQQELQRAMAKPTMKEREWIMVIDLRKCIGCSACTIACKAENHLPPGVVYRPVIEQEEGEYPNVTRHFLPRPCMQCDDPPCTPVCPVSAPGKRDDGIIVIDYNACIGCRYCLAACPYSARYFDFGEDYTDDADTLFGGSSKQPYEEAASPEYGKRWTRTGQLSSPVGNARTCQFCIHRLDAGMLPACVTTCIGGATYFGDEKDPDSLVNELLARGTTSGRTMRLKEELGTDPHVYYLL
ncbi:MAG: 4Fe-4S dicluster domain-containing protein [Chloroflexota bacterium]|nr:4Fe-4S dicluster domain-containing protein [Chloroflexota bacterium]